MDGLLFLVVLVLGLTVLDVLALRFGSDSRDHLAKHTDAALMERVAFWRSQA